MSNPKMQRTLYLVKDGIKSVGCKLDSNGNQIFRTNFYLITYDFITNEGYIERKEINEWRLYTQIGQSLGQSRYHTKPTLNECIEQLKSLSQGKNIRLLTYKEANKLILDMNTEILRKVIDKDFNDLKESINEGIKAVINEPMLNGFHNGIIENMHNKLNYGWGLAWLNDKLTRVPKEIIDYAREKENELGMYLFNVEEQKAIELGILNPVE